MSFKPFKYALLAAGFGSAALLPFWSFAESAPAPKRERTEIHFSADQVEENSETKVITATGNVNIVREGTTLKADKITYDRKNDKITADGHVNIIQPDGTTVFADSAELEDKMSKGAIHEVKMILADESRVAAQIDHFRTSLPLHSEFGFPDCQKRGIPFAVVAAAKHRVVGELFPKIFGVVPVFFFRVRKQGLCLRGLENLSVTALFGNVREHAFVIRSYASDETADRFFHKKQRIRLFGVEVRDLCRNAAAGVNGDFKAHFSVRNQAGIAVSALSVVLEAVIG